MSDYGDVLLIALGRVVQERNLGLGDAFAVLDAVAPIIRAEAWDEGHLAGRQDSFRWHRNTPSYTKNPYLEER